MRGEADNLSVVVRIVGDGLEDGTPVGVEADAVVSLGVTHCHLVGAGDMWRSGGHPG